MAVAFDAIRLSAQQLNGSFARLLDANNMVLATLTSRPLGSSTTVSNYDLGLVNYTLPATGAYSVRVYGRANFDYYLAVAENLALDTENTGGATTPRYTVTLPGSVVGHMNANDVRDLYAFQLNAGQVVRLTLTRPEVLAGVSPANTIAPRLLVTRPNGAVGTSSETFNASGQIIVNYRAVESGQHFIDVRRLAGAGVYSVRAQVFSSLAEGEGDLAGLGTMSSEAVPSATSVPVAATPIIERPLESPALSTWQNALQPQDINGDNRVTPLDALLVINELNKRTLTTASAQLPPRSSLAAVDNFFDANGDGVLTPLDALLVIDRLNRRG